MTLGAWLSVAAICTLGAVSPGPSLAVVVRHALASRAAGVACALAHAFGVGPYAAATVFGLAAMLIAHAWLYRAVSLAGAVYLVGLGLRALGPGSGARIRAGNLGPDWRGALRDGLGMALLNPKVAVFFLALFSQFVAPRSSLADAVILTATAAGIDAAWYLLVALAFSGSAVARLRRRRRILERITGVCLIGLGAWALTQALTSG